MKADENLESAAEEEEQDRESTERPWKQRRVRHEVVSGSMLAGSQRDQAQSFRARTREREMRLRSSAPKRLHYSTLFLGLDGRKRALFKTDTRVSKRAF